MTRLQILKEAAVKLYMLPGFLAMGHRDSVADAAGFGSAAALSGVIWSISAFVVYWIVSTVCSV